MTGFRAKINNRIPRLRREDRVVKLIDGKPFLGTPPSHDWHEVGFGHHAQNHHIGRPGEPMNLRRQPLALSTAMPSCSLKARQGCTDR